MNKDTKKEGQKSEIVLRRDVQDVVDVVKKDIIERRIKEIENFLDNEHYRYEVMRGVIAKRDIILKMTPRLLEQKKIEIMRKMTYDEAVDIVKNSDEFKDVVIYRAAVTLVVSGNITQKEFDNFWFADDMEDLKAGVRIIKKMEAVRQHSTKEQKKTLKRRKESRFLYEDETPKAMTFDEAKKEVEVDCASMRYLYCMSATLLYLSDSINLEAFRGILSACA